MALTYLDTAMIEQPTVFPELSVTGLQIGNITSSTSVIGDLTIYGQLTALSGFNVVIASTTSTSALSVSNIQARPALDVYQGPAHPIISVFKNNTGSIATIGSTGIMVSGSGVVEANSADTALRITQRGSGNALVVEDSTTPDTTPFVITSAGNVGIGTSTPNRTLTVSGNISATGGIATGTAATPSGFFSLGNNRTLTMESTNGFTTNLSGFTIFKWTDNNLYVDNYDKDIVVRGPGAATRVRITQAGNVGIGTASPSTILHVRATTSLDGLTLDGGASGSLFRFIPGNLVSQGSYNGITQTGDNTIIYTSGVMNSGSLVIAPWTNTTGGIRMLSSGIVGIGTPSPNQTLTVAGNISATGTTSMSALNIVSGSVFRKTTFSNLVSALAINVNGTTLYMPLLSAI